MTEIIQKIQESVHSKFIVTSNGSIDHIVGILYVRDFLEAYQTPGFTLDSIVTPPILIPESASAFRILNLFKTKKQYIAVVVDEHGGTEGIITLHDLMEVIIGDLPDEDEEAEDGIIRRENGEYLVSGKTLIYELNQYF